MMPTIIGTNQPDTLNGTEGDDLIQGLDGDDVLFGLGGNDQLEGGEGADRLDGGAGSDVVHGGGGNDTIVELKGASDQLFGDGGDDRLIYLGATGNAQLLLDGGAGDDYLEIRSFYNGGSLIGGAGHDRFLVSGAPQTTVDGGDDADLVELHLDGYHYDVTLGSGADIVLLGGDSMPFGSVTITDFVPGDAGDALSFSQLLSMFFPTTISPFSNGQLKVAQSGADTFISIDPDGFLPAFTNEAFIVLRNVSVSSLTPHNLGGYAPDGSTSPGITSSGSAEVDFLAGNSGDDSMSGAAGNDVLFASGGDDSLSGGDGDDELFGETGNDVLLDDHLNGGRGADMMTGGLGNDIYDVDDTSDSVTELSGQGTDEIRTTLESYTLVGTNVENLTGTNIYYLDQRLTGNDGANVIKSSYGNDTLDGGAGSDTMLGGQGDDAYIVDDAGDQVIELVNEGNDTVYASRSFTLGAGQSIETLSTSDATGTAALNLTGNALAQTIIGNAGANVLTGGGGADYLLGLGGDDVLVGNADANSTLQGGTGDDWYHVNRTGDSVLEAAGEGSDRVYASVSFTLSGGQEVEVLAAADGAATTALVLTGNNLGQFISGNAGANTLIGGGGSDYLLGLGGDDILVGNADAASTLQGGTGDDWYYVYRTGDSIIEFAGEGSDRILSAVNYTLSAGQEIETLTAIDPTASNAIDLTGNALAQNIFGNAGANTLTGGGGADYLLGLGGDDILIGNADAASTLQGGTGNDWYYVSRTGDSIIEFAGEGNDRIITTVSYTLSAGQEIETLSAADQNGTVALDLAGNDYGQLIFGTNGTNTMSGNGGADQLVGFGGDDILLGGDGDDLLNGGAGHDVLNGGAGADLFVFADALGGSNVDAIQDFASGADRILLDHNVFSGLSTGALASSAFVLGTAAQDADDRIVYNQATGELWFDADGNGAGAAVLFATLAPSATLAASDFAVV
jgi:Ca2+-binding RTX toxin-like protein